jgi:hypothetical protein
LEPHFGFRGAAQCTKRFNGHYLALGRQHPRGEALRVLLQDKHGLRR